MRSFNADGGEGEACGNASRCGALLAGGGARIETTGGVIGAAAHDDGATVDIGEPRFGWDDIPLAYPLDTSALPVGWDGLREPVAVNVVNPHIVFFRSEEHTSELQSLMCISYAGFCLKKKNN